MSAPYLYCTEEQDIHALDHSELFEPLRIWRKPEEVPLDVMVLMATGTNYTIRDYWTPLREGKSWLFELTQTHQPRTGQLLLEAGELGIRARSYKGRTGYPSLDLGLPVRDKMVYLRRELAFKNFCDLTPEVLASNKFRSEETHYLALPEPIRLAYYHRFNGLVITDKNCLGALYPRLLPERLSDWRSVDYYIKEQAVPKQRPILLAWLAERFPFLASDKKTNNWTYFRAFLRTRYDYNDKRQEDALFVDTLNLTGVVYHVKNCDIQNMRKLADPVEALDRYCEHILLGREGRFDFLPYTVPL